MKDRKDEILYCFKFEEKAPDGIELAAEMLSALEVDFSSYHDRESDTLFHTVYALSPELREQNRSAFEAALPVWQEMGMTIAGEVEEFQLKRSEWAEAWKNFFQPLEVSERLIVRPEWRTEATLPGQKILTLNPGLCFGTGQHPTTLYCLQEIDRISRNCSGSMLDAGCGTGILAIAAAMLGFSTVDAFDFDPDAVETTVENLVVNRVDIIKPEVGDAAVWQGRPEKYDLVCANILGHLLIAFRENIATWVKAGGTLVLAGILSTEFDKVSQAYQELGFTEVKRCTIKEWTGGTFTR